MRIIGITGGIGSGKSTVSSILCNLGAKIIDADVVSRRVVSKGQTALDEIVTIFGSEVLDNRGELDRKKIADIVFADHEKLQILNSITHKFIAKEILEQIEKVKEEGVSDTVVVDAALPFEHGFIDTVGEIWVVSSNKELRIKRIMERNNLTYEEALARINSQLSEQEYFQIADEIILNDEDITDLEKSVVRIYYKPD